MMTRLLLINANATAAITDRLATAARAALPGVEIVAATAAFGARYIASRASFAVAAHAALDAYARHATGCAATLLACFGDPGLEALREVSPRPVVSLIEASVARALTYGPRFAIVTGGAAWGPMLRENLRSRGLDAGLAGVFTVAPDGGAIARDPQGAVAMLAAACDDAARASGADSVILGGAGLLGLDAPVGARARVPVIGSVEEGFRAVPAALAQDATQARGDPVETVGLSRELCALLGAGV